MKRKYGFWLRLFNLREGESLTVRNLVFHHFFLGFGQALLLTVAGTYFLSFYKPEYFPVAYMLSALVMMLAGRTYSYFEHAVSVKKLMQGVVLTLVLMMVLFRLTLYTQYTALLPVIILIGFRLVYLLTNLEFWGLSSLVFDVRQGKRLFGLISSGDVPAKLMGYLSVSFLVPLISLNNLLWIAAGAFAFSFFFLRRLLLQPGINLHVKHRHDSRFSDKEMLGGFFGNRFIFTLSTVGFFMAACFTLIDFAFLYNVQQKYHSMESLASFLSIFFAIGYTITIIIKLLFSGRLAEKGGIMTSLLIMPVLLLLFSLGFIVFWINDNSMFDNLAYIGIMSMAIGVVKYSINDPVYLALFQPLPAQLRLKGHTVIKGFVQPLALGLTGAILWIIFQVKKDLDFMVLNGIMIIMALTWVLFIFKMYRRYVNTLSDAIKKRFLPGTAVALESETYAQLLWQSLGSEQKEDIVYAINSLDERFPEVLRKEAENLLKIDDITVKRMILRVMGKNRWHEFSGSCMKLFEETTDDSIRAEAAFLCAQASYQSLVHIFESQSFHSLSEKVKCNILSGLMSSGSDKSVHTARQRISEYLSGNDALNRIISLDAIAASGTKEFREEIKTLLFSKDEQVREKAIYVAGRSRDSFYIDSLIDLLLMPLSHTKASESLSEYGDDIFDHLGKTGLKVILNRRWLIPEMIRIAEKTSGRKGGDLLFSLLPHIKPLFKEKIIDVLGDSSYVLNPDQRKMLEKMLREEIAFSTSILDAFSDRSLPEILHSAFEYEFESSKQRIISIAGLLYNRRMMREAAIALRNVSKEVRANALEVMEQLIPRKTARVLVVLLENIPAEEKLSKLRGFNIVRKHEIPDSIIREGTDVCNEWTVCVALRSAGFNDSNFIHAVNILRTESILLQQAAAYHLMHFKENNPVHFDTLISTFKVDITPIMKYRQENSISEFEKIMVLKGTALFSGTPENIIAEITPIVREVHVQAGDSIFRKGDSGSSMYIIYNGEIKIHDGERTFATLGKRDFFGELALLDPEPRSASATAATDALLFKLEEEEAYELMEERVEVLRSILRILCRRIRMQNEKMVAMSKGAS